MSIFRLLAILMEFLKTNYNVLATALFLLFIIIAHLYATNGYSIFNNTISDLGAQGYNRKFIMQFGFLVFGILLVIGVIANGFELRTFAILVYGLSIAMTGIFCTTPFLEPASTNYSVLQTNLHSLFAQIAGVAFTIGILVQVFYAGNAKERTVHLLFFGLVIGLSVLFGLLENNKGIAQRLLYLVSFIWFMKFFDPVS